ncbi:MAG: M20/M25/M40 family metallo-hydrolase, partial [Sphingobacteriia bacterium]|nr:M20/M25/M40 family metallo-hydrolase [Sphingobacteriia bacterium]
MNTVDFLKKYVACQSVSSDDSKLSGMADARAILCNFFKSIDFSVDDLPTAGHNVIIARNKHNPANKTVMFYGHYDVQPVEPLELWTNDPFTLTEKNGRLFGRGASDNKGAHTVILAALKNLHDKKIDLNLNIIFLLEGEEEIGSRNMASFLQKHKDSLKTDIIISTDTVSHDEQNIVITTGLRGLVTLDVTVKCNDRDLHSGYGGPIANPIQVLCEMCAKLHDSNGRVTISGFYDNVDEPIEIERQSIK